MEPLSEGDGPGDVIDNVVSRVVAKRKPVRLPFSNISAWMINSPSRFRAANNACRNPVLSNLAQEAIVIAVVGISEEGIWSPCRST